MALHLREKSTRVSMTMLGGFVALFILLAQPLLNLPAVFAVAGTPGSVVINEFSSGTSMDWVELYNTTESPVDVTNWVLRDSTSNNQKAKLTGTIAAHGFLSVDFAGYLNDGSADTVRLFDDTDTTLIDSVHYGNGGDVAIPSSTQFAARTTDGAETWELRAASTRDATNSQTPIAASPEIPTAITNTNTSATYDTLQQAIDAATAGDVLRINEDLTVSQRVNITKLLTIDGQNHTLSPNFTGPGAGNANNATLGILANNVTLKNLVVDGANGTALHGIITYQVTGISLNSLVLKNNDRNGLVVNGSTVAVDSITTANNGWGGIDVDLGSGVTQPALLTVTGVSVHNESGADIYVDDDTKAVGVNAPGYQWKRSGWDGRDNDRIYILAPVVSSIKYTERISGDEVKSGKVTNEKQFTFDLRPTNGAVRYQLKYWNDIAGSSFKQNTPWAPTNLAAAGKMAENGVYKDQLTQGEGKHYFSFSACDADGVCSEFTDPFVVTYDATAPAAPVIASPKQNQFFVAAPIRASWSAVTDPSGIAQYQIQYIYADGHTFSGDACDGTMACRSVSGSQTWRDHAPGTSEQGKVTIKVRAIDQAGNMGAWSAPVAYTYDQTKPIAAISGARQTSATNVEFNGYVGDANFSHYYCWLTKKTGGEIADTRGANCVTTWAKDLQKNGNPATATNQGGGTATTPVYLGNFNIDGLDSGEYIIHLMAKDRAGNMSSEVKTTVLIDRTAPSIFISDIKAEGATVTIKGTSDTQPVRVQVGERSQEVQPDVNGEWVAVFNDIESGTYTVEVSASDGINTGSVTRSPGVTVVAGIVEEKPVSMPAPIVPSLPPIETSRSTPNQPGVVARLMPFARTFGITAVPGIDNVLGVATDDAAAAAPVDAPEVQGVETKRDTYQPSSDTDTSDVLATTATRKGWSLADVAWYWWLALLAAAGATIWMIAAWRRRRAEEAEY